MAKNASYPWLVLIPRVDGATDLIDLNEAQQRTLLAESTALQWWMLSYFQPEKLNVAMLGNIVNTLHVHHGSF